MATELQKRAVDNLVEKYKEVEGAFIYIVKSGDFYKIGYASSLSGRLHNFEGANPNGIELIWAAVFTEYKKLEKMIHERFNEKRVKGEWFKLNEEDIELIKKLDTIPIGYADP